MEIECISSSAFDAGLQWLWRWCVGRHGSPSGYSPAFVMNAEMMDVAPSAADAASSDAAAALWSLKVALEHGKLCSSSGLAGLP